MIFDNVNIKECSFMKMMDSQKFPSVLTEIKRNYNLFRLEFFFQISKKSTKLRIKQADESHMTQISGLIYTIKLTF